MISNKKLLIFDFDGVMIDSYNANVAYFNHCLETAGCPPLEGEDREFVAYMSVKQLIWKLFAHDEVEAERVYSHSQTVSFDPFRDMIHVKFNFHEVLSPLRERGHFLAVASNRGKSLVSLFRHFNLFEYIQFKQSSLDAPSKPDPAMVFNCISYFGVEADESVFFGDSISDYQAAQNAGVDHVWVGEHDGKPRISSLQDLLMYL